MSGSILVTGGLGFIGSNLVRRLIAEGYEVGALDNLSRGNPDRLPRMDTPDFRWRVPAGDGRLRAWKGDVRDADFVLQAVGRYDTVFHLAFVQGTQTFYSNPKDVVDVGFGGIMNILAACEHWKAKGNQKSLVLVSSSEAYQIPPAGMTPTDETVPLSVPDITNPRYSYGGGKIASEVAAMAYAQAQILKRMVIVRPHNVVGEDMGEEHVMPQLARRVQTVVHGGDFEIQGDGSATRCFNDISDCVDGLMLLLEKGENKNVYHLGDPREEVSIIDLARRIADHYDRSDVVIKPSQLPQGSPLRRVPDISKLQSLGYEPKVSLAQTLHTTLEWYRNAQ